MAPSAGLEAAARKLLLPAAWRSLAVLGGLGTAVYACGFPLLCYLLTRAAHRKTAATDLAEQEASATVSTNPKSILMQSYNEVILDASRAWNKKKAVVAIFLDSRASTEAVTIARDMCAAAAADGLRLPLLSYSSGDAVPFHVLSSGDGIAASGDGIVATDETAPPPPTWAAPPPPQPADDDAAFSTWAPPPPQPADALAERSSQ